MNRLQKKCFIVSASLHGLLLLVLVFGSALSWNREKPLPMAIKMFDPKLVTDALTTGGDPTARTAPPPADPLPTPTPAPPLTPQNVEVPKPPVPVVHQTSPEPKPTTPIKPVVKPVVTPVVKPAPVVIKPEQPKTVKPSLTPRRLPR